MRKELVEAVIEEARSEKASLVVWDERDTFTVEPEDLDDLEVADDHLKAKLQDGRTVIYVGFEAIHKLVVNKERSRAGFGIGG